MNHKTSHKSTGVKHLPANKLKENIRVEITQNVARMTTAQQRNRLIELGNQLFDRNLPLNNSIKLRLGNGKMTTYNKIADVNYIIQRTPNDVIPMLIEILTDIELLKYNIKPPDGWHY